MISYVTDLRALYISLFVTLLDLRALYISLFVTLLTQRTLYFMFVCYVTDSARSVFYVCLLRY